MTNLRSRRPYIWALTVVWALPAVAFTAWILTAPDHNPDGECEGIGFGCTLTPHDGAVFLAVFSAPVLLLVGGLSCLVIWAVRRRGDRTAAAGRASSALRP